MSNMYTCAAYLIEIRKFCSKNLVHKGVNFEAQNGLKLTYEHCGDAFPIEGVLVATYLLSVEALPHCRCGVANKNRIV